MNKETLILANRGQRLGGALIDLMIIGVIITPIMLATGMPQSSGEGMPDLFGLSMTIGQRAAEFVLGWSLFLILNGYLLFNRGQTIGKVAVKTKIIDLSGNIPNFGKLLVFRYLVLGLVVQVPIIGALGLVNPLFIFGKAHRCLHDYIAGTLVVEA